MDRPTTHPTDEAVEDRHLGFDRKNENYESQKWFECSSVVLFTRNVYTWL